MTLAYPDTSLAYLEKRPASACAPAPGAFPTITPMSDDPEAGTPGVDDTAAFQRFYSDGQSGRGGDHGLLYRLLIGWWRDRR